MQLYKKGVLFLSITILLFFGGKQLWHIGSAAMSTTCSYVVCTYLSCYQMVKKPFQIAAQKWTTISALEEKIVALNKAYDDLLARYVALIGTQTYEDETAHLVAFKKRYALPQALEAQVILRSFSDHGHFYLVNIGSRHGVQEQMVAFLNNCLVGRVTTVQPFFSVVTLITDVSCKVAAYCGQTKIKGIHEGINEDAALLCYVDLHAPVELHDVVVSTGQGMVFPQGFALGIVESVLDTAAERKIQIKPAVKFKEIDYCLLALRQDLDDIFK